MVFFYINIDIFYDDDDNDCLRMTNDDDNDCLRTTNDNDFKTPKFL